MIILCFVLTSTSILAQPPATEQTEAATSSELSAPPPKLVSPQLESSERPARTYKIGEVIPYQIRVKWPEQVSDVRMSSPQITLENLELIGVAQETVSKSTQIDDSSVEQILTLQFKASHPGPAKIDSLILKWTQADGLLSSDLKIPPVELTITKSSHLWPWFVPAFLLFAVGASLAVIGRKKRKLSGDEHPETIEEKALNQLRSAENLLATELNHHNFLHELTKILDQYIHQKFNWNRGQDDYNALQKKADKILTQKEVRELEQLYQKIEYSRFAGSEVRQEELMSLFQAVRSFIERKKVI